MTILERESESYLNLVKKQWKDSFQGHVLSREEIQRCFDIVNCEHYQNFPGMIAYIYNVPDNQIISNNKQDFFGLDINKNIDRENLDDLVINEQRPLAKNDTLTVLHNLVGYHSQNLYYSSERAVEINNRQYDAYYYATPIIIRDQRVFAYYITITLLGKYTGKPFKSKVFYSEKTTTNRKIKLNDKLELSTNFKSSKLKLFNFFGFTEVEMYICKKRFNGISNKQIQEDIEAIFSDKISKRFVTEFFRTSSGKLQRTFRTNFPDMFEAMNVNHIPTDNILEYLNYMFNIKDPIL